jgi:DNA-binding PadR family transcriptional regulator
MVPRLSYAERRLLEGLREQERFGHQFTDLHDGAMKRGTVYVTLGRMRAKGYVTSRTEPLPPGAIGLARRWYRPTPFGLRLLDAWIVAERWFAANVKCDGAV